jgi:hypothetical protein
MDDGDISWQIGLHMGSWSGAKLICYTADGLEISSHSKPGIIKFDGRLPHEVVFEDFQGVRYSVICFQAWHEDKLETDPIFSFPKQLSSW